MSDANRPTRNWKSGAWGAALAVLFGLLQPPPVGPWLEDLSYDLPFRVRANIPTSDAVIIYMDKVSSDALKQPWESKAWDRGMHARLLKRLTESHAKAVVFDILFDQPSTNDEALLAGITAATNAGAVVLVGGTTEPSPNPDKAAGGAILAPFEALEAIAPWGLAEEAKEEHVLRRHYIGAEYRGWIPSLSWRTAELTVAGGPPGNPWDVRWINYYGAAGWIESYSYHNALDPILVPGSFFSNKVCFVGALPDKTPYAGATRADLWRTPYSARMAGVEIIATVYLNLARKDFLHRMPVSGQLLIIVAAGLLFGWGLTLFRPIMATGVGVAGMLAVAAAACWLMANQHAWFSWLIVAVVQIPVSVGWSVLAHTKRLSLEKLALETQLAAAQTALKEAATSEAATLIDPSTLADRILAAAKAPAIVSRPLGAGAPVIPDHDLVRRVGKGAYGEVWLARNVIGTYHAVKIVKREDFQSDDPFEREFKGIQKFMPISRSHPGLVQILHAGRNHEFNYIYYIMEMADDETTGQEIQPDSYSPKNLAKEIKKRRHLPAAECLQLSLDLTAALDYLHQHHLIHRDIKPSNIIFVQGAPKFADIGLVTDIVATGRETTFLGTLGYIAPEGPGTRAADVFSLGKVLYETSMGLDCQKFPEISSTICERSDFEEHFHLNRIILKACEDDLTKRYRTALEMREDLLKLQTSIRASEAT